MNDNLTHEQAVKMDLILAILKNSDQQYPGNRLGPSNFYKELKISEDETKHLLLGIISQTYEGADVVKSIPMNGSFGPRIQKNFNTDKFLNAGGFVQVFKDQEDNLAYRNDKDEKEEMALDSTIEQALISRKSFNLAIVVAITGWLAFFITLFLELKGFI